MAEAESPETSSTPTPPSGGEQRHQRITLAMRIGAAVAGGVFLGLAAVDAIFGVFPAEEKFFAITGTALIVIGITGRWPRGLSGGGDEEK